MTATVTNVSETSQLDSGHRARADDNALKEDTGLAVFICTPDKEDGGVAEEATRDWLEVGLGKTRRQNFVKKD